MSLITHLSINDYYKKPLINIFSIFIFLYSVFIAFSLFSHLFTSVLLMGFQWELMNAVLHIQYGNTEACVCALINLAEQEKYEESICIMSWDSWASTGPESLSSPEI